MPFEPLPLPLHQGTTPVDRLNMIGAVLADDRLTAAAKNTFSAIVASYVRSDGSCWPTYEMMARMTCQKRRAVINHVRTLIELGYLAKDGHVGQANRLALLHSNMPEKGFQSRRTLMGDSAPQDTRGASACTGECTTMHLTSARPCTHNRDKEQGTEQGNKNRGTSFVGKPTEHPASSPRPPIEPVVSTPAPEVTVSRKTTPKPDTTAASKTDLFGDPPKSEPKTSPLDEAVQIWREVVVPRGIPNIQGLTDKRRKKLTIRLKELGGIEGWRDICRRIAASDYLTNKWPAKFDWVIEPGNMLKIQEGNYDNRLTPAQQAAKDLERRNQMAREAVVAKPSYDLWSTPVEED